METKTTRLPVDLIDAAEASGRLEHRSTAKQIEHWARFGMSLDAQTSGARHRVQRVLAGDLPIGELDADEQLIANAALDARISVAANSTSFAERLAAIGVTTVVMDEDGHMVRRAPDGTTTPL